MPGLQDLIHHLEEGRGLRWVRVGLAVLAIATVVIGFNLRGFRNMSTQEAMDSAQLGRNLAEGQGFTTLFVRPFSMHLVAKHNRAKNRGTDLSQIKAPHPDLANPPVYPLVLAGLMKAVPMDYTASTTKRFWSDGGLFSRYQPDFFIGLFNQLLFLILIGMVFLLARKLFDPPVAWLSALLLLGTEVFWRFSVSGLSTVLLALIFIGVSWCVVRIEQELREPQEVGSLFLWTLLAGALLAVGGLTRYAFGWLLIPLLLFLLIFGGGRRILLAAAALLAFAALMTPWLIRNYNLCGHPFGTAGFALLETTAYFPTNQLQRSLEPDFSRVSPMPVWIKLIVNSRQIFQTDLLKMGGSWVTAFFLVGLLVGFRKPSVRRLRHFLLLCLLVLIVVQALGRTQLAEDSPEINSENLLVLLTPLTIVFGVSLFFLLLDQITLPVRQLRYVITIVFAVIACLPMAFTFLPPRTSPVAFPPYHPVPIQTFAKWLKPSELSMSDIPWAMAWYGRRQSVWLTLNSQKDFVAIHDYQKPISMLYIVPAHMDGQFLPEWRSDELSWGHFVMEVLVNKEIPPKFPLPKTVIGLLPQQVVLTDWERWRKPVSE